MFMLWTINFGTQNIKRKSICFFIPGKASFWKPGGLRQATAEYREQFEDIIQEVSNYKVKMENILCKTDIKEQDHLLIVNKPSIAAIDKLLWSQ